MNTVDHDFLQLVDNEPLTLICGPLADFLFEDFIRDARPIVRYLADHYNIRELSRFGKELFDRLYNQDEVEWLITLNDYEEYFRAVSNGEPIKYPKGYKTEHGMWWSIMSDLTNAPNWLNILAHAGGNQFAAGNCAVSILNQLSELIEQMIDEGLLDIQKMQQLSQKLQELRQQMQDALDKGDQTAADKARKQGKAIAQELNNMLQNIHDNIKVNAQSIIYQAQSDSEQLEDDMSTLCGDKDGAGSHAGKLQEKKELAKKLRRNRQLREICKKLGAIKQAWTQRKRAVKAKASYESIVGAEFSNNLLKAFPTELALASSDAGKKLFALKYSQRTILTKSYDAKRTDLNRGPICLYIDTSGSMLGERETWAKAVALAVLEHAQADGREVQIHLFDNRVGHSETFTPKSKTQDVIDYILSWNLGGGTSFEAVLSHAANLRLKTGADILMITDGYSSTSDKTRRVFKLFCESTGSELTTIVIGGADASQCRPFSDKVYALDDLNPNSTADTLIKALP